MTVSECLNKFYIELDALASGVAPGFEPEDVYALFDKVQDNYIKSAVLNKNYSGLEPLLKKASIKLSLSSIPYTNTYSGTTETMYDFYYYISSRALINRTNPQTSINGDWVECDLIQIDIAKNFAITPFNKPYFKNPVVFIVQNINQATQMPPGGLEDSGNSEGIVVQTSYTINLMTDYYTTLNTSNNTNFQMTYVSKPTKINANWGFSLNPNMHTILVSMAVMEAAKSFKIAKMYPNNQQ